MVIQSTHVKANFVLPKQILREKRRNLRCGNGSTHTTVDFGNATFDDSAVGRLKLKVHLQTNRRKVHKSSHGVFTLNINNGLWLSGTEISLC